MCDILNRIQNWAGEEVDGYSILMLGLVSWIFYLLALAFPSDMIAISDTFDKKEVIAWLTFGLFAFSAAFMLVFVVEYVRRYGEHLLFNVLLASGSISSLLLFAFWRIADAKGYCFLSPFSPVIAYLTSTTILAVALHLYWTAPYMLKADYDKTGIFDDVFIRG